MGFFGKFTFADGEWNDRDAPEPPYLSVDIHDSDIATVDYRPAEGATGRFFLGFEPRVYFEDEAANSPTNRAAEAKGFAGWVRVVLGREVDPGDVERLLPKDDEDEPENVFVETTVKRLLVLAGLPVPDDLPTDDEHVGE